MATRTFRASLETLEDRLAPAHLSLLSPLTEHGQGLGLGLSHRADRLEIIPSLGANVELNTPVLSLGLKATLSVSLVEISSPSAGVHVSLGTFVLSEPLLTVNADLTVGPDASPSGSGVGVGVGVGVGQTSGWVGVGVGQTPGGTGGTGGVGVVINPTPGPVQQPPTVSNQPAANPTLLVVPSQAAALQIANPNAATAVAVSATNNALANLVGRAQPAFVLQPVSTGAADASLVPAALSRADVGEQGPAGGRLPKPDAGFAEGGSDKPEKLDQPDFELPPAPPRQDSSRMDAAPVILELGLAGASPEVGFAPGLSEDGGEDEAGPLMQAGLGGEGGLSSWLIFALAVSGLAVAQVAASQSRRRRRHDPLHLADESSLV